MGWLTDALGFGFGFGFGAKATDEAFNLVESKYRSDYFDPVIRQDLRDILVKGMLENKEYPFPTKAKKEAWRPFFVRHKIFSISIVICLILIGIIGKTGNYEALQNMVLLFWVFWIGCILVMFVKKVLRGGKKVVEFTFYSTYIQDGRKYWKIREYVRRALASGDLTVQEAVNHLRNTELGRKFPDSQAEIEANAYYYRQKQGL